MVLLSIISVTCVFIPIAVYISIERYSKNAVCSAYDFIIPLIIAITYSLISIFLNNSPKTYSNLSIDLSLLSISLLVYGMNIFIKNNKVIIKALFTIIPISTLFFVLFFVGFIYE